MKISYNWLKWYIPEVPDAQKLADILTYHLAEVETVEEKGDDFIFDIKILPNRAHDLLCHHGVAKEIASLLGIAYNDPTPKYKIPEFKKTNLEIKVETDKCRRYTGRIVRNVKIGPSPEWVVRHLASIGQRSINNVVDGANLTMFDCGQPIHAFDLDKVDGPIIIRAALEGEQITTLDNKEIKLKPSDMVIADNTGPLAIAGIKGGKRAEVDNNTKNLIIEVANFDPTSVRKTGKSVNLFTDAIKRYENDLSPELCTSAMVEMSGLMVEYGFTDFEEIVDVYPHKPEVRKLLFRTEKISKILGLAVSVDEIKDILKRYNFEFTESNGVFEITVPTMRLDLTIEEDMAEEIGRILGYDKVKPKMPEINFKPKVNETYSKIRAVRNKLLSEGYSEVMTYVFKDKGEVSVFASASDKKFLRTNLVDGLKESIKLNQTNIPLLGMDQIKVFEIGTVFKKDTEEMHVAYGDKKEIKEMRLEEFPVTESVSLEPRSYNLETKFKMWSLFPFIARDVAVWVPENVSSEKVLKVIKENAGEMVVKGPEFFDEFKKDGKVSYAFRTVFQSYDRTLTDEEINEVMNKITEQIQANGWQVR